jgi:hypothetical protein
VTRDERGVRQPRRRGDRHAGRRGAPLVFLIGGRTAGPGSWPGAGDAGGLAADLAAAMARAMLCNNHRAVSILADLSYHRD